MADSYFGLHSVNPTTGEKTLLLANSQGTESFTGPLNAARREMKKESVTIVNTFLLCVSRLRC